MKSKSWNPPKRWISFNNETINFQGQYLAESTTAPATIIVQKNYSRSSTMKKKFSPRLMWSNLCSLVTFTPRDPPQNSLLNHLDSGPSCRKNRNNDRPNPHDCTRASNRTRHFNCCKMSLPKRFDCNPPRYRCYINILIKKEVEVSSLTNKKGRFYPKLTLKSKR